MTSQFPGMYMGAQTKPFVGICSSALVRSMSNIYHGLRSYGNTYNDYVSCLKTVFGLHMIVLSILFAIAYSFYSLDSLPKQDIVKWINGFFNQVIHAAVSNAPCMLCWHLEGLGDKQVPTDELYPYVLRLPSDLHNPWAISKFCLYIKSRAKPLLDACNYALQSSPSNWKHYSKTLTKNMITFYNTLSGNYVVIATLLIVMILTFLLPDISHKLQVAHDLKNMKQVMGKMSSEVKQAEVACMAAADQICCIHCSLHDSNLETSKEMRDLSVCTSYCMRTTQSEPVRREKAIDFLRRIFLPKKNSSNKEITLMSYVYTDSFDAQTPVISANQ